VLPTLLASLGQCPSVRLVIVYPDNGKPAPTTLPQVQSILLLDSNILGPVCPSVRLVVVHPDNGKLAPTTLL
jgi:hypothetical protein